MAASQDADALLDAVESAVDEAIQYFQGPGATSRAIIDQWGPREVLCHFLFWHEVTIEGMQSVAHGGDPLRLQAAADELNAEAIARHRGMGLLDLTARLRVLQEELRWVVHSLPNMDVPVMIRVDGTPLSGRQRLEAIGRHWAQHMVELKSAE